MDWFMYGWGARDIEEGTVNGALKNYTQKGDV